MANKPPKTKKKYGTWAKNFGKSMMFGSKEVLAETSPYLSSTIENLPEQIRDLRDDLHALKQDKSKILGYLIGEDEKISEYASIALKNAKQSLKTGKFYDEHRQSKLEAKALGMEDFDDDMDDGSDFNTDLNDGGDDFDDDLGFDDTPSKSSKKFSSVEMGPSKIVNITGPSTKAIGAVQHAVNLNTDTTAKGFIALDSSNKQLTTFTMAMNEKYHNQSIDKLDTINGNISQIISFNNESMSPFVQGSLKYYDESLSLLSSMNEALQTISGNNKKESESNKEFDDQGYSDIFGEGFNIASYSKRVGKNIKKTIENSPLGILSMFNDPMILSGLAANPLGLLMKSGLEFLIPEKLLGRIKHTDKTISSFMPALFSKIASYESDSNPLISFLASIFGVKQKLSSGLKNLGDYERGAISYDGESKKALTEVIPTYLAKISQTLDRIANNQGIAGYENSDLVIYDWEKGVFTNRSQLVNERDKKLKDLKLSGFTETRDIVSDLLDRVYGTNNTDQKKKVVNTFDNFLASLVDSGTRFSIDDLFKSEDNKSKTTFKKFFNKKEFSSTDLEYVEQILKNLPIDVRMELYGSGVFEGRNEISSYYNNLAKTAITGTNNLLDNGILTPWKKDSDAVFNSKYNIIKDTSINSDDLDEQYHISREDIKRYNKDNNTNFKKVSEVINDLNSKSKKSKDFTFDKSEYEKTVDERMKSAYADYLKNAKETKQAKVFSFDVFTRENPQIREQVKDEFYSKTFSNAIDKRFSGNDNTISGEIGKLLQSPIDFITRSLRKVDETLYKVIFGFDDDGTSIFDSVVQGIKDTFSKVYNWLADNIFKPLKDFIFSFNPFDSDWFKSAKDSVSKTLFGDEKTGKKGLFTDTMDAVSDFAEETKNQLKDAKDNWLKPTFDDIKNNLYEYIFGPEDEKEKEERNKQSMMEWLGSSVKQGVNEWTVLMLGKDLGTKDQNDKVAKQFFDSFKNTTPNVARGVLGGAALGITSGLGGFGILGSMFLPGGPIGGAIVGGALGILHSNEAFKEMLYGKEVKSVDANGNEVVERTGGLISKNTMDFFKKNKVPIVGGAAFGALKVGLFGGGIGLIPSMAIGITGPILAGSAWGMAMKSKTLQEALFGKDTGEKDANGKAKKVGGLVNKQIFKTMKKALPRSAAGALGMMGTMGVIGELGIVGSALAMGPMSAAMTGAALGLLTSSENFNKGFFGYTDKDGKYHSGALDKAKNYFTHNIFKPTEMFLTKEFFKNKKWFFKSVVYPLSDTLIPLKVGAKKITNTIGKKIGDVFTNISDGVKTTFLNIGNNLVKVFDTVLKPIKFLGSSMIKGLGFLTRTTISAASMPLFALGSATSGVLKAQGYMSEFGKAKTNLKNDFLHGNLQDMLSKTNEDGTKTKGSLGNFLDTIIHPVDTMGKDEYAGEILEYQRKAKERDRKFDEAMGREESALYEKRYKLELERKALKENKWGLTPEQIAAKKARLEQDSKILDAQQTLENSDNPVEVMASAQVKQGEEQLKKTDVVAQNTSQLVQNTSKESLSETIVYAIKNSLGLNQSSSEIKTEKEEEAKEITNSVVQATKANLAEIMAGDSSSIYSEDDTIASHLASKNKNSVQEELQEAANAIKENTAISAANSTEALEAQREAEKKSGKSWFSTVFDFFKDLGSGVFGLISDISSMGDSLIKIGGIASAVYVLYKLLLGDKSPGGEVDNMIESSSAGNIAERVVRGGTKATVSVGRIIGRSVGGIKVGKEGKTISENILDKTYSKLNVKPPEGDGIAKSAAHLKDGLLDKIDEVLSKNKWFSKAKAFIKNTKAIFKAIIDVAFKSENLKLIMQRAGARVLNAVPSYATIGFALYDMTTGWNDAYKLFDVAPEDCDFKMKLISSLTNTIFGLPYMWIIDTCLSLICMGTISLSDGIIGRAFELIGINLKGFDHRKAIARLLYNYFAEDQDISKLNTNQQKLANEYNEFVVREGKDRSTYSLENYLVEKKGGSNSIWQKYGSPLLKRVLGVEEQPSFVGGGDQRSVIERITEPLNDMVNYVVEGVKSLKDKDFGSWIKTEIFGLPDEGLMENLKNKAKEFDNSISSKWENFKKNYLWNPGKTTGSGNSNNIGSSSYTISSKIKNTANQLNQIAKTPGVGFEKFIGGGDIAPTATNFKAADGDSGIPFYWNQNADNLKNVPILEGNKEFGTFGEIGCAPTSLSMVASLFNGVSIDPLDTAKLITPDDVHGDSFFEFGPKGINSSYFGHAAPKLGLNIHEFSTNQNNVNEAKKQIIADIGAGKATIVGGRDSSGKTPFTSSGHYVVIAGRKPGSNDDVFVYDPLGKSGVYSANSILDAVFASNGYIANFMSASANKDYKMVNGVKLLNLDKYGISFKLETNEVDYEHLTPNAKAALDYISKYFKKLTGRKLVVSSGYRTTNTMGGHATGNCFDVVDDMQHETLEKNEKDIRTKLIDEACRVGIKVFDEYEHDSKYKTAGHLHMDATTWLNATYDYTELKKRNKPSSIFDLIGRIAKNAGSVFIKSLLGEKWEPEIETDGIDRQNVPELEGVTADQKQVYQYLASKGYNSASIAGIMGNIQQESNFKTDDVALSKNSEGVTFGGVGLFQWNDDRATALKNFASENGLSYVDPITQLRFFSKESEGAYKGISDPETMNAITGGAEDAASHFAAKFEVCNEKYIGPRREYASQFYKKIMNNEFSGAGGKSTTPLKNAFRGSGDMKLITSDYARRVNPPKISSRLNYDLRNAKSFSISESNIATNEPGIYDLILAIKTLDSHAELSEIINYLRIIASEGGLKGNNAPKLDNRTAKRLHDVINKPVKKTYEDQRMEDLMRAHDSASVFGRDSYELAYKIATGGDFKQNI